MDSKRPAKDRSKKLFALLVLTGASVAASLPTTGCNDNKPAPAGDAGDGGSSSGEGGGAHFW